MPMPLQSPKTPTTPKKSELTLSDHSLIIIQDTTPDVVSTNKLMKSEISKAESIFSSSPKKH